jgi:hypothetical protein
MSTQLQSFASALSPELAEARAEIERLNERVIPGLNKQLTEQFELSTKLAAENLKLERALAEYGGDAAVRAALK